MNASQLFNVPQRLPKFHRRPGYLLYHLQQIRLLVKNTQLILYVFCLWMLLRWDFHGDLGSVDVMYILVSEIRCRKFRWDLYIYKLTSVMSQASG